MIVPSDPSAGNAVDMQSINIVIGPAAERKRASNRGRLPQEPAQQLAPTDGGEGCAASQTSADLALEGQSPTDWYPIARGYLQQAEQHYCIGERIPPLRHNRGPIGFLARITARVLLRLSRVVTWQQRVFNESMVRAAWPLQDAIAHLERTVAQLTSAVEDLRAAAQKQNESRAEFAARLGSLEANERSQKLAQRLQALETGNRTEELAQRLQALETGNRTEELAGRLQALETGNRTEELAGRLQALETGNRTEELAGRLRALETGNRTEELSGRLQALETGNRTEELAGRLQTLERNASSQQTGLLNQERRLGLLLEETRKRLSQPSGDELLPVVVREEEHALDAYYLAFEDQFRGSRDDIKQRLREYLPVFHRAVAGEILDLGCGRGEWLELLQEESRPARGIDQNRMNVEQCIQSGLKVVEAEIIHHLRELPEASLAGVTAFHVLEHLPFQRLVPLLDETLRVLKPGGVAIFETPNPSNVLVGSCTFWLDPTHQHPLPSSMLKFLVEKRGFCRVEVINLHPRPEKLQASDSALADRINDHFYGPQDYAIVGWKM
jgi:O-antigen chain-terminating methyltransferase